MSAMDGFDDPEETAGSAAAQVYQRYLLRRSAVMLAATFAFIVVVGCDWASGILALWLVPPWLTLVLGLFIGTEIGYQVTAIVRRRRKRRAQQAGLTGGDKMTAALDRLAEQRAAPVPPPWWRTSPLRRPFWQGTAVRGVYSSCLGLVVASWSSVPAGIGVAAGYTVATMVASQAARPAVTRMLDAAVFIDPRPPRDSPEA
jgi:hypothetical protein